MELQSAEQRGFILQRIINHINIIAMLLVVVVVVAVVVKIAVSEPPYRQKLEARQQASDIADTEEAAGLAPVGELTRAGMSLEAQENVAVINGATTNQSASDKTANSAQFFSAIWYSEADDVLMSAAPDDGVIILTPDTSYAFTVNVSTDIQTAENVRFLVQMPETIRRGETAEMGVLITADNAVPYYATIPMTYQTTAADESDKDTDEPDETLAEQTSATDSVETDQYLYFDQSTVQVKLVTNSMVEGIALDNTQIFVGKDGALLGYVDMDGVLQPGSTNGCQISWTITPETLDELPINLANSHVNNARLEEKYQKSLEEWQDH